MSHGASNREYARTLGRRAAIVASAVGIFGFFAWIVGPGLVREWNQPATSAGPADTTLPSSGWLDPTEAPARKGRILPPLDPAQVMTPRPELVARGRKLFQDDCVSCHGDDGRGNGPAATGLVPAPRNFTSPNGWTNGYRIADIYRTVTSGVKGTGMAAFDYLPPADRMALIHFVRSLGKFDHGPEDQHALDQLASEFRSSGGRIPNRIPVSRAIAKLVAEAPPSAALVVPRDPAMAELVRRVVSDPERAMRTLTQLRGKSRAELGASLAAGAPANGFRAEVAALSLTDWQLLGSALENPAAIHPEG
jgi:mono/diheme cytochrome c family protein